VIIQIDGEKEKMVRDVQMVDVHDLCEIYNYYVKNTIITFEETPVSEEEIKTNIATSVPNLPWLVFEKNNKIVGYAFASQWKSRCAYKFSVESTIYLDRSVTGQGIGSQLYEELISRLRMKRFHAVIGGIALPNDTSIAFHVKHGFEKIAHFREVGFKFGKWIDVGYWELILTC
jgi:phosphinothricin acetyltransferase